jgi:hypothetical protein
VAYRAPCHTEERLYAIVATACALEHVKWAALVVLAYVAARAILCRQVASLFLDFLHAMEALGACLGTCAPCITQVALQIRLYY